MNIQQITQKIANANGDLNVLSSAERSAYYIAVCESMGLDPLTQPLMFLRRQDGATVLYAKKEAATQLAQRLRASFEIVRSEVVQDVLVVHGRAYCEVDGQRRVVDDIGAAPLTRTAKQKDERGGYVSVNEPVSARDRANAYMVASTRAYRRAILKLAGTGILDESEVIEDAVPPVPPMPPASPVANVIEAVNEDAAVLDEGEGGEDLRFSPIENGNNTPIQSSNTSTQSKKIPEAVKAKLRESIEQVQSGKKAFPTVRRTIEHYLGTIEAEEPQAWAEEAMQRLMSA